MHTDSRSFRSAARALILLLTLFTAVAFAGQARRSGADNLLTVAARATLRIENLQGNIRVELGARTNIEVSARRRGNGTAVNNDELAIADRDNSLTINTRPASAAGDIDLIVRVPAGTHLRLISEAGDIELTGAPASLLANTTRGDIRLNLPNTINADISLSSSQGAVMTSHAPRMTATSDAGMLQGRIGDGGAIFAAHTNRGQVTLSGIGGEAAKAPAQTPSQLPSNVAGSREEATSDEPAAKSNDIVVSTAEITSAPKLSTAPADAPPAKASAPERPARAAARDNDMKLDDENVLRIDSQLVTLNVSVSKQNGQALIDLQKEDFTVFEDKIAQEIAHFQTVRTPFNLVLLIDLSGSVRDKIKLIKKAAIKFIKTARPEDRIAIVTFSGIASLVSDFTSDRKLLEKRIDKMEKPDGGTNFYDALTAVVENLIVKVKGQRNAIVVMSDGVDNSLPGVPGPGSDISYGEMLDVVQESGSIVFPIYLDTEEEAIDNFGVGVQRGYAMARQQLQELSDATGGMMFYARRVEDLEGRYEQVASELRTIYSIGYYPNNSMRDGKFRKINVTVKRDDARVRTRRGYYANK